MTTHFNQIDLNNKSNVSGDLTSSSLSYFLNIPLLKFNKKTLNQLIRISKSNGNVNVRVCLHGSSKSYFHDMIILIVKNTYVKPHKHIKSDETIHVIRGKLMLTLFNDEGLITNTDVFSDNEIIRVNKNIYHTVIPITSNIIIHENKCGPYKTDETITSPWSPDIENTSSESYIQNIVNQYNYINKKSNIS